MTNPRVPLQLIWLAAPLWACGPNTDPGDGDVSPGSWRLHQEVASMPYVSWEQSTAGTAHVEYSFDEGEWHQTPTFEASAGSHEQILLGIPYNTPVQWRVVVETEAGSEILEGDPLTTGPLPGLLPPATLVTADPDGWDSQGNYLLTSICQQIGSWNPGDYWTFIVDRKGRPVWAIVAPEEHWTLFAQVSVDGTSILWDESTYWLDWGSSKGAGSTVHRRYLDAEIEVIPTDGIVHAFVELDDGTIAWGSQYHASGGEALVELAPGASEVDVVWTCGQDYPGSSGAYCATNGLFYDANSDSYLGSFWDESTVIAIDRTTGENLWWAGEIAGSYAFVPPDAQFTFQHGVSVTEAGNLLLHSGGHETDAVQMAREYAIDHEAEALTEVWNYGRVEDEPGALNGDVWRLPSGNTLHTLGSAGKVKEIAPDGTVVWHLDFQGEHLMGRSGWIDDLYDLVAPR
jgi:hypothetical protein